MSFKYRTYCLKKGWIALPILPILFVAFSCKELVKVDAPKGQLSSEVVFSDDASAISATSGLYSQMIEGNLSFSSSGMTLYAGMSADELVNTTSNANDEFSLNALTPDNSAVRNNIWDPAYYYIHQANAVIEGLKQSAGVSSPAKDQLTGEALFTRAFCHFYLTGLFGDVPLVTTTDYQKNIRLPQTPYEEVFQQILADLEEAGRLMPAAYASAGKGRPNQWAASLLLARACLYQADYLKAEEAVSAVIESGVYHLEENPDDVFLAGSPETIWELLPVQPGYNTWEGNLFIPAPDIVPSYAVTDEVINSFEPGDARKKAWLDSVTLSETTYRYPAKYKVRSGSVITENYVVFRLAEAYLIRAEACARQGNLAGAKADLDVIRRRAGLPLVQDTNPGIGKEGLLDAILKERQTELFTEWGHRWLDLKRTGRVDPVMQAAKGTNWQPTDALYPIPAREIQMNPFLTQNPGYQ